MKELTSEIFHKIWEESKQAIPNYNPKEDLIALSRIVMGKLKQEGYNINEMKN